MTLILYSCLHGLLQEGPLSKDLLDQIPLLHQEKVLRFKRKEDQYRCLIGKLLIKKGLKELGQPVDDLLDKIQYTAFNKPFFADSPINFNLSHSGDYVICAISMSYRIGIDIEKIKSIPLSNFSDQMSMAEWARIYSDDNPLESFYRFWTRKEAIIKANGKGFSMALNSFSVIEDTVRVDQVDWFITEIRLAQEYACHLATNGQVEKLKIMFSDIIPA